MESSPEALSEGRRIYLGNLHYVLKPHDIEEVLHDNGFGDFESVHISIDPVSARNPGYCFVDFGDRATTERALTSLTATIRGRPLKVGPCEPKTKRRGEERSAFQRWGDWRTAPGESAAPNGQGEERQGPRAALVHFDELLDHQQRGVRVYVGGLTKMVNQAQNHEEVAGLFTDFKPLMIGKRITPHESTSKMPGNHHYCFLDFETLDEAEAVIKALNGTPYEGGVLKVSLAKGIPDKLLNKDLPSGRRHDNGDGRRRRSLKAPSEDAGPPKRAMASRDWRRKDE